jgi:hypothetical protein
MSEGAPPLPRRPQVAGGGFPAGVKAVEHERYLGGPARIRPIDPKPARRGHRDRGHRHAFPVVGEPVDRGAGDARRPPGRNIKESRGATCGDDRRLCSNELGEVGPPLTLAPEDEWSGHVSIVTPGWDTGAKCAAAVDGSR